MVGVSRECVVGVKSRGFVPGDAFGLPYLASNKKGLPWLGVCDTLSQGLNEDKLSNTGTFLRARS